jgi:hypothetical protein
MEALQGMTSQWIPVPSVPRIKLIDPATGEQKTRVEIDPATGKPRTDKEAIKLLSEMGSLPFSVFVTLQETEDAGDLLLAVTKVADDSKAGVSKAFGDAFAEWLKSTANKSDTGKSSATK